MLPELWFWLVAGMLCAYVVLGGGDLGVGALHLFVARDRDERAAVIETIRPIWKPNEVWLVAAGGTLFLAFPKLLAVAFSGFYLPLMIVLWLLVLRGLGIELRYQIEDPMWRGLWDVALCAASLLLALCLGAALGNVLRGVPLDESGVFFEPLWTDFTVSEAPGILDWFTVSVGLLAVVALAHHGAHWLAARAAGRVRERADRAANLLFTPLLVGFATLGATAFALRPALLDSLQARPWGALFPLVAALALAATLVLRRRGRRRAAFHVSALALAALFLSATTATFPDVLPARDPEHSLTLQDAAAAPAGLAAALWWWVPGMAFVIGCFAWMHRRIGAGERASN